MRTLKNQNRIPPVHISTSPVTKSLSGEQKNNTAPAASSAVPGRPKGLAEVTLSSIAGCTPTRISCPLTSIVDSAVRG